jgi:hypothetical protein
MKTGLLIPPVALAAALILMPAAAHSGSAGNGSLSAAPASQRPNRLVAPLPGEIVAALPRQIVPPLRGQLTRPLPGQIVRALPGQIVQPLSGQIVR